MTGKHAKATVPDTKMIEHISIQYRMKRANPAHRALVPGQPLRPLEQAPVVAAHVNTDRNSPAYRRAQRAEGMD